MRRVIRRRIRHTEDGLDVAVDFNADVSINVGQSRPTRVAEGEEARRQDDPDPSEASEEEGKQP
jgi:hypothetical protein